MTTGIQDKVIIITGASSGLGEATARLLSAQGATVVLGARRVDRLQAVAKDIIAKGGKAVAIQTDVLDRGQVTALVDTAVKTYGRVDVMLNNAGLMPQAPLERLKVDEWDRMIDVNIKGVLYGIARRASPHEGAQVRPLHQRLVSRGSQGRSRLRGLRRDKTRRSSIFGGAAAGSEALQYPNDGDLAGRGRNRTAQQRDRSRCR